MIGTLFSRPVSAVNPLYRIGNNVLMMERCLRTEATHLTRNKLESLVALHLDDMHYVHDIMQLQMQSLNNMLCEHLLNTLLIPLYVYSLDPSLKVWFCLIIFHEDCPSFVAGNQLTL